MMDITAWMMAALLRGNVHTWRPQNFWDFRPPPLVTHDHPTYLLLNCSAFGLTPLSPLVRTRTSYSNVPWQRSPPCAASRFRLFFTPYHRGKNSSHSAVQAVSNTAVSSEAWAKLRDWASVAGRGRLLLSGSAAHASLETAVCTSLKMQLPVDGILRATTSRLDLLICHWNFLQRCITIQCQQNIYYSDPLPPYQQVAVSFLATLTFCICNPRNVWTILRSGMSLPAKTKH